MNVTKRNLTQN